MAVMKQDDRIPIQYADYRLFLMEKDRLMAILFNDP